MDFFQLLEEKIFDFVKSELKNIKEVLGPNNTNSLDNQWVFDEVSENLKDGQSISSREALYKITLNLLKEMNKKDLADRLQNSKNISTNTTHADDVGVDSDILILHVLP